MLFMTLCQYFTGWGARTHGHDSNRTRWLSARRHTPRCVGQERLTDQLQEDPPKASDLLLPSSEKLRQMIDGAVKRA